MPHHMHGVYFPHVSGTFCHLCVGSPKVGRHGWREESCFSLSDDPGETSQSTGPGRNERYPQQLAKREKTHADVLKFRRLLIRSRNFSFVRIAASTTARTHVHTWLTIF